MTEKAALLAPEVLETVWTRWYQWHTGRDADLRYCNLHRQSYRARQFENWLFEQGAEVRQINKKRHLRFYNERTATLFLLRWL